MGKILSRIISSCCLSARRFSIVGCAAARVSRRAGEPRGCRGRSRRGRPKVGGTRDAAMVDFRAIPDVLLGEASVPSIGRALAVA
jgi:hypothetical protein